MKTKYLKAAGAAVCALLTTLGLLSFSTPAQAQESSLRSIRYHRLSLFCWDDPSESENLIIRQCPGRPGPTQRWVVIFTYRGESLPGLFQFRNLATSLCVDAIPGMVGGTQESVIRTLRCEPEKTTQQFVVDYAFNDDHWHQAWRNVATGMCLNLRDGVQKGSRVVNWPCNRTAAQLWRLVNF